MADGVSSQQNSQNYNWVTEKNGRAFYRASALDSCPNAFIFNRQGLDQVIPPNMQKAFDEGNALEPLVINRLIKLGYRIINQQKTIRLDIGDTNLSITGHIDGEANYYKDAPILHALIEVKCLNHTNTLKFLADPWKHFPYYAKQVSAYFYGINAAQIVMAIYDKDTDTLHDIHIIEPPVSYQDLTNHVCSLEVMYSKYQHEDIRPPCTSPSFCAYWHLHGELTPPMDDLKESDPVLAAYIIASGTLKAKRETLERLEKVSNDKIKAICAEKSISQGKAGDFEFHYSETKSARFDTRSFKEDEPDTYKEYCKEVVGTRLEVKKVEE